MPRQDALLHSHHRRSIRPGLRSTAIVRRHQRDSQGIPHVTFDLIMEASGSVCISENRTLALSCFLDLFPTAKPLLSA